MAVHNITDSADGHGPSMRQFWSDFARDSPETRLAMLERHTGGLNLPFAKGRTPLCLAAASDDLELAQRLLALGANADAPDLSGRTPLHIALASRAADVTELLLDAGANIEVEDGYRRTPLMYALFHGADTIAIDLINRGARLNVVDEEGRSVRNYAEYRLKKHGAPAQFKKLLKHLPPASGPKVGRTASTVPAYLWFLSVSKVAEFKWTHWCAIVFVMGLVFGVIFTGGWIGAAAGFGLSAAAWRIDADLGFMWLRLYGLHPLLLGLLAVGAAGYFLYRIRKLALAGTVPEDAPSAYTIQSLSAAAPSINRLFRVGARSLLRERPTADPRPIIKRETLYNCFAAGLVMLSALMLGPLFYSAIIWVGVTGSVASTLGYFLIPITLTTAMLSFLALLLAKWTLKAATTELTRFQEDRNANARRFLDVATNIDPADEAFALYLRSFYYDERLEVDGQSFEAALVYSLCQTLEVVALGRLEGMGSARLETPDETWRQDFKRLADRATLIFIVPGDGAATLWEVEHLLSAKQLTKTVFVMPPASGFQAQWLQLAWDRFIAHPPLAQLELPAYWHRGAVFTLDERGRLATYGPLALAAVSDLLVMNTTQNPIGGSEPGDQIFEGSDPYGSDGGSSYDIGYDRGGGDAGGGGGGGE